MSPTPEQLKARKDWVAALRSGRYAQIQRKLHNEEGFCCLGVGCDLVNPNGWNEHPGMFHFGRYGCDMPDEVLEVYGISPEQHGRLMTMNDREGKTFPEIADYIESTLIAPFEVSA